MKPMGVVLGSQTIAKETTMGRVCTAKNISIHYRLKKISICHEQKKTPPASQNKVGWGSAGECD
jgi:hypothetical protein